MQRKPSNDSMESMRQKLSMLKNNLVLFINSLKSSSPLISSECFTKNSQNEFIVGPMPRDNVMRKRSAFAARSSHRFSMYLNSTEYEE